MFRARWSLSPRGWEEATSVAWRRRYSHLFLTEHEDAGREEGKSEMHSTTIGQKFGGRYRWSSLKLTGQLSQRSISYLWQRKLTNFKLKAAVCWACLYLFINVAMIRRVRKIGAFTPRPDIMAPTKKGKERRKSLTHDCQIRKLFISPDKK